MKYLFSIYFRTLFRKSQYIFDIYLLSSIVILLFLTLLWGGEYIEQYFISRNIITMKTNWSLFEGSTKWIMVLILDLFLKLYLQKDNTCMPVYLQSRPVKNTDWYIFLCIKHFWSFLNFLLPVFALFYTIVFSTISQAITIFFIMYITSVNNGILVMFIKKGNGQKCLNKMSDNERKSVNLLMFFRTSIWDELQIRTICRVKLLTIGVWFYPIGVLTMAWLQSHDPHYSLYHYQCYILLFAVFGLFLGRLGLSAEVNFFDGIWSRPISIENLLISKYRLFLLLSVPLYLNTLVIIPTGWVPWQDLVSALLYSSLFGNMLVLGGAFMRHSFPLTQKLVSYMITNPSYYRVSDYVRMILFFGIEILIKFYTTPDASNIILMVIGIFALLFHRKYFLWRTSQFFRNRYYWMNLYRK